MFLDEEVMKKAPTITLPGTVLAFLQFAKLGSLPIEEILKRN
jgi:hypothetical protein